MNATSNRFQVRAVALSAALLTTTALFQGVISLLADQPAAPIVAARASTDRLRTVSAAASAQVLRSHRMAARCMGLTDQIDDFGRD